MPIEIAPSVLAADFGRLREQVEEVAGAGAHVIHIDVMDGHFVPPLSMGPPVCRALRGMGLHLEVHLMVERPERQVESFAEAGADTIIVHAEATPNVHYALQAVRDAGCSAGLAVNPATPLGIFAEVEVDVALCMSVNPGWGGQQFIEQSLDRIGRVRAIVGDGLVVEVDGGVEASNAGACVAAGASRLVAGTSIFGTPDPAAAFREIAAAAEAGLAAGR
jgi:ribulose-phosphate 3-epimerase